MTKAERFALFDTIAILALGICSVVGFCLAIDWLRLYLFPLIAVVGIFLCVGVLFITTFEWRLKVNSKRK